MEVTALNAAGIKPAEFEMAALANAKAALVAIKPNVIEVLVSADRHDPAIAHARRTLTGVERATAVWAGIVREERALANPTVRAVRLVERWDVIAKDFQSTGRDRYGAVRPEMAATLREFSKAIINDPGAAAVMHERPGKVGTNLGGTLSRAATSPNVGLVFAAIVESIIEPPSRSISYSR